MEGRKVTHNLKSRIKQKQSKLGTNGFNVNFLVEKTSNILEEIYHSTDVIQKQNTVP
jgi:hypothetical protein